MLKILYFFPTFQVADLEGCLFSQTAFTALRLCVKKNLQNG